MSTLILQTSSTSLPPEFCSTLLIIAGVILLFGAMIAPEWPVPGYTCLFVGIIGIGFFIFISMFAVLNEQELKEEIYNDTQTFFEENYNINLNEDEIHDFYENLSNEKDLFLLAEEAKNLDGSLKCISYYINVSNAEFDSDYYPEKVSFELYSKNSPTDTGEYILVEPKLKSKTI